MEVDEVPEGMVRTLIAIENQRASSFLFTLFSEFFSDSETYS